MAGLKPVRKDLNKTVNIAVSSRALFRLEDEHKIWEDKGREEYVKYQKEKEEDILNPGPAHPFIQVLKHVNTKLLELDPDEKELFDVILMSHNAAATGLEIERMCLTDGADPVEYLEAYNVKLFLSCYPDDTSRAIRNGFAAAAMKLQENVVTSKIDQLRIAFDLDAVLFSAESDEIYKKEGLEKYFEYEKAHRLEPLEEGPLKSFAEAIGEMQTKLKRKFEPCPIRTYFVTARSVSVGERAIRTLREWNLDLNEIHFLGGADKGPILRAIKPHIFFDDLERNITSAKEHGIPAGHVN